MKRTFLPLLLLAALTTTSCSDYLTPEGAVTENHKTIPTGLQRIEVGDGIHLILDDAVPAGTAIVRTHANIQPYIEAEPEGDKLTFHVDARRFRDLDVKILTSPTPYTEFTASGGSQLYSHTDLAHESVALVATGGSGITLTSHCRKAIITSSGGSHIDLDGSCDHALIDCSGGSHIRAYDFPTAQAEVNVSGGSRLEIRATESLTGENSGGSTICYRGTPALLNINNSGGSTTSAE